jgi:DNA-binding transcriptional ArsR family regulator
MSLKNPYGDFEITDPQALRALAHPVRLALLERLQRDGPATATQLSPHVGATPSVVSWHLRHLAGYGLVKDWDGATSKRERWWQSAARGFRFSVPEGADGEDAARQLSNALFLRYADAPNQWMVRDQPRLETGWLRLSGMQNTRVLLTAEELEQVESAIQDVLAPFVRRKEEDAPTDARGVRFMRYTMPEPSE